MTGVSGSSPSGGGSLMQQAQDARKGMMEKATATLVDAIDHHRVITIVALAALSTLLILGMAGIMPLPSEALSDMFGGGAIGTTMVTALVLGVGILTYKAYQNKDKGKVYKYIFLISAIAFAILGACLLSKDQKLLDFSSYGPITANAIAFGSGALAIGLLGASVFKTGPTTNKILAVVSTLLIFIGLGAANMHSWNTGTPGSILLTSAGSLVALPYIAEFAHKLFTKKQNVFAGMRPAVPHPPPVVGAAVPTSSMPPLLMPPTPPEEAAAGGITPALLLPPPIDGASAAATPALPPSGEVSGAAPPASPPSV